jgi:hypothetical protein
LSHIWVSMSQHDGTDTRSRLRRPFGPSRHARRRVRAWVSRREGTSTSWAGVSTPWGLDDCDGGHFPVSRLRVEGIHSCVSSVSPVAVSFPALWFQRNPFGVSSPRPPALLRRQCRQTRKSARWCRHHRITDSHRRHRLYWPPSGRPLARFGLAPLTGRSAPRSPVEASRRSASHRLSCDLSHFSRPSTR